ncbi:MAG: serine/threonine-protein kinase [Planctomycetota bacterium]|jgi:tetratricopeptide (TPR) repeat protein
MHVIGQDLGPYAIEAELGAGGMGTVYRATGPEGTVALKVVHPHLLATPGYFKRFLREAEVGKRVVHENVVRTLDVDAIAVAGTQFNFLVMECVEGQTLRELIAEAGCVPEELCRHIGREVAGALHAIHEAGVVHRDLKPENVLITADNVVKVMDLGVAQLADAALRLSQTGAFLGTILYAAPEQFEGADPDPRSDLYSLGLVLYELATGQHPMRAEDFASAMRARLEDSPRNPAEINPQVSPFLEQVIATLTAREAADRFGSAAELREVLEQGEESDWWTQQATLIRERTKRPLRRVRIPRETALYGRDGELARLEANYERAAAGEGQVLLIEGEAGIGKTRLVDEFAGRLGAAVNYLFGSYPPGGAATEAGAFSTAYREHFGAAALAEYLPETPLLAAAFAALLRGEPAPQGEQPLNKESLQTVFIQATRVLAEERPTILLIDDLHFAPPEGLALFAALAMAVPHHRVLLIGTMRRGMPESWTAGLERLPQTSRLPLARLGPKDLAKLLVDAFRSERLAQELSFKIATKSDGNPFFVFEIIRGLREGQFLTQREDGKWITTQVIEKIEIPSSVAELIQARIASLDEKEREILDVASCCGFDFDATLVAEAIGAERIPAFRRLARIEKQHQLVRAVGRRFAFDHHQVQEALYAGLPEVLQEEYHAALGNALEHRTQHAGDVLQLCEHFMKGGHPERAKPHLNAALEHLDKGYLHETGLDLLSRALAVPDLLTGGERAAALVRKVRRLSSLGRRDEERAAIDEALPLADASGDRRLRAKARIALAANLGNTSQYAAAAEVAREVLDLAREEGARDLEALAHEYLGLIGLSQGRPDEALRHNETALGIHDEIDDPRGKANLLGNQGQLVEMLGRIDEARALHEQARELASWHGDREGAAMASGNLGTLAYGAGHLAAAREHYESALAVFTEIGTRRPMTNALGNLAELWLLLGNLPRAQDYAERTLALAEEIEFGTLQAWAILTLGQIAWAERDRDRAEPLVKDALERVRAIGVPEYVANALLTLAEVAEDDDRKRVLLEESIAVAEEGGAGGEAAVAGAMLAELGGDAAAVAAALEEQADAMRGEQRMRARFLLWRATGDRSHLIEAHRLLTHMHDHAPEDCRTPMIENVPLHRDITRAWEEQGLPGSSEDLAHGDLEAGQ